MEKIIEKILEYVEVDGEITADTTLKSDCGLTSFDTVCLIGDLCGEFGVDENKIDMRNVRTVGELASVLGV